MATLREMKDEGWSITFHCRADVALCTHSWKPSWDQLIQYFGTDADFVVGRSGLERLVCENCGGRGATIIVHASDIAHRASGGHSNLRGAVSVAEATRRHHERELERQRLGIKTNEEIAAASREAIRAKRRAAKSGADLIGPPNPFAHRKRGRKL